ncbi:protein of unknown function (plasmid) [Azospirillum baldaniorum]|uniref:Ethanolamine ammonia-lyase light chain n=3 Tax=Azospirillum baldaniorum TaxID=1064539 RepID=A0A9P1NQR7_9PROT|nr:protein of unknown function [Azospirillum baldaniorum]
MPPLVEHFGDGRGISPSPCAAAFTLASTTGMACWAPAVGAPDPARNCISNIRLDGLAPEQAVARIADLVRGVWRARVSGVALAAAVGQRLERSRPVSTSPTERAGHRGADTPPSASFPRP